MKQTFDRHISISFDQPSQSGAAFAGERRFSKSKGLSASVSFLSFPLPLFHFLALVSFLARSKPKVPFLGISLLRNQRKRLLRRLENVLRGCVFLGESKNEFMISDHMVSSITTNLQKRKKRTEKGSFT